MRFGKLKIYFSILITFVSILIVLPTFINLDKVPFWMTKILPENKIKLGLDLQGGLHLVLGVEVDKVILESTDRFITRIKEQLEEDKVEFKSVLRVANTSNISINFNKQDDVSKIRKLVSSFGVFINLSSSQQELIYDFTDEYKTTIKERAVSQTIEAIRNRIDEFGVNEPSIQAQGTDRVLIQLPGVKDPERAKAIVGRTAKLEFKIVVENQEFNQAKLNELLEKAKNENIIYDEKVLSYNDYVLKLNQYLEEFLPENTIILFERIDNKETLAKTFVPYLLEKTTKLGGDHLVDAFVLFDNTNNKPYVSFELSIVGSKIFEELTGNNIGKRLAIVLDNNIYSAPTIQSKISRQGQITLGGMRSLQAMQEEAQDLALVLRAGALPAELVFEEERVVGPSLGIDSIKQGSYAMILGTFLIIIFMFVYYRKAGLIADLALILNILFITATLILFEATLTLPGIAGVLLTIGMSVDANIIVFERIREEIRSGNNIRASVESGYAKALSTIIDANVTTAIAGIVLFQYGTGPIKGFAVTLLIGIVFSVFTAIFISKWIFRYFINRKNIVKISI